MAGIIAPNSATRPCAGASTDVMMMTAPQITNSRPPNRCVLRQDSSLLSVQGVRLPMNQFDFSFGS